MPSVARRLSKAIVIGSAATLILGFVASSGSAGSSVPVFGTPVYVDQQLAGGEPEVIADTLHGGFVYLSDEPGEQHGLQRPGPDLRRGRAPLQHRHRPRQRRAVLVA